MRTWGEWRRLLAEVPLPAVLIDLPAFEHNTRQLLAALGDAPVTLRLASKSLRCPALMRRLIDAGGGRIAGLMTFSAHESALLAREGFDDLLCAYPFARADEADAMAGLAAEGVRALAMVDDPEQLTVLEAAAARRGVRVPLCLDVDVSLRLADRLHLGVRRSPVRGVVGALSLARAVAACPHLSLEGVMAYEAQVAGMPDRLPGVDLQAPVRRWIKARSRPLAAERRKAVVAALRAEGHAITLVNGGGTGSLDSTAHDGSCTEVTAGSGFLCPTLFDHYTALDLRPAAFFALAVVRRSDPGFVTCAGGGWIASGPPAHDRQPSVWLPRGLSPLPLEGFGEVQTPLALGPEAPEIALGDPVLCRHAKGGEVMERARTAWLVDADGRLTEAPTLRGLGGCYL